MIQRFPFRCFSIITLTLLQGCQDPSSLSDKELYVKLTGPDPSAALETVLDDSESYSALTLFAASGAAFKKQRFADAAFLLYAGQLRVRFDKECFPPTGTGGNNPFVAYAAYSQTLGMVVNPAIMSRPKDYRNAVSRLRNWTPKVPSDYDPQYEYASRKSLGEALNTTAARRTEFITKMNQQSQLLNDKQYFEAQEIVKNYNFRRGNPVPSIEQHNRAMETMLEIEKEKGIKGTASFYSDQTAPK